MSATTRRMNAESSTTSTVWTRAPPADGSESEVTAAERPHQHAPLPDVVEHAPSVVAAHVLADDADLRLLEHAPRRVDVALAHVDPARGQELAEHARAAGKSRRQPSRPGAPAEPLQLLEHQRQDGLRE